MYRISAIVCTYNREFFLKKALDSLAGQSLSADEFEIVLVNNNSTDSTEQICKQFQQEQPNIAFTYVIEKNQGLSFARNRGIVESKSDLVTFIDDDAWLEKDFLKKTVEFMESNPEVASVGGIILLDYEDKEPSWMNKYMASLFGYFKYSDKRVQFSSSDYPRGSNMTFRTSVFEEIGDFNTELGRVGKNLAGGEEKDIYQRIYKKGLKVWYLPESIVYHAVPLSRTTEEFIRRQSIGVGISERLRIKGNINEKLNRYTIEIIKWGATLLLSMYYLCRFQIPKAGMLIRFRYWVSKGLFTV